MPKHMSCHCHQAFPQPHARISGSMAQHEGGSSVTQHWGGGRGQHHSSAHGGGMPGLLPRMAETLGSALIVPVLTAALKGNAWHVFPATCSALIMSTDCPILPIYHPDTRITNQCPATVTPRGLECTLTVT